MCFRIKIRGQQMLDQKQLQLQPVHYLSNEN
jgi:hypothetical protein